MPEFAEGQVVLYHPHLDHALDDGADRKPVFHWVHAKDAPRYGVKAGESVDWNHVGEIDKRDATIREPQGKGWHDGASLKPGGPEGFTLRPGKPKHLWLAVVKKVNADGTCDLEIEHANGCSHHLVPDRAQFPDAKGLAYDATASTPHTFCLPDDVGGDMHPPILQKLAAIPDGWKNLALAAKGGA